MQSDARQIESLRDATSPGGCPGPTCAIFSTAVSYHQSHQDLAVNHSHTCHGGPLCPPVSASVSAACCHSSSHHHTLAVIRPWISRSHPWRSPCSGRAPTPHGGRWRLPQFALIRVVNLAYTTHPSAVCPSHVCQHKPQRSSESRLAMAVCRTRPSRGGFPPPTSPGHGGWPFYPRPCQSRRLSDSTRAAPQRLSGPLLAAPTRGGRPSRFASRHGGVA